MDQDLREFPQFALGVGGGFTKAILTDPDVFCMAVSGLCLGSQSSRIKGIGVALGMWVVARRADQYMTVIDSRIGLLAQLIRSSNKREEING